MKKYDVVIIGSGPAGLAAAIYTAREGFSTLVIEKNICGGVMATIDRINNYPGCESISGEELSERMWNQAEEFGTEIKFTEVLKCCKNDNVVKITTDNGEIDARTLVITTGNTYKKVDIVGGERIHYCATCDGPFYKDKNLVVIGGGNSAVAGALFLSRFAKRIDLVIRKKMSASKVLADELKGYDEKISIHLGAEPKEVVVKDDKVTGLKLTNERVLPADGIFVFIGAVPCSESLNDSQIELDEKGYVKTDEKMMTNIDGIFAAGDIRSGNVKQIAVAVGEGATAANSVRKYLENSV